jgi:hypothetical protein
VQQSQTTSQTSSQSSFFDRLVGVVTLDVPTYHRIERDRRSTLQAAGVVGVVAIAAAIGRVSQFSWLMIALLVTLVGWVVASGRAYAMFESLTRKSMNRTRLEALRANLDRRQEWVLVAVVLALLSLIGLNANTNELGWSSVALTVPFLSWLTFSGVAWFQARQRAKESGARPRRFSSLLSTVGFAHAPGVFAFFGFIPLIGLLLALIVPIWAVLTMVFAVRHTLGFSLDQALATAILATSATAIGTAVVVIVA